MDGKVYLRPIPGHSQKINKSDCVLGTMSVHYVCRGFFLFALNLIPNVYGRTSRSSSLSAINFIT